MSLSEHTGDSRAMSGIPGGLLSVSQATRLLFLPHVGFSLHLLVSASTEQRFWAPSLPLDLTVSLATFCHLESSGKRPCPCWTRPSQGSPKRALSLLWIWGGGTTHRVKFVHPQTSFWANCLIQAMPGVDLEDLSLVSR
jgi:hypothetical protein